MIGTILLEEELILYFHFLEVMSLCILIISGQFLILTLFSWCEHTKPVYTYMCSKKKNVLLTTLIFFLSSSIIK